MIAGSWLSGSGMNVGGYLFESHGKYWVGDHWWGEASWLHDLVHPNHGLLQLQQCGLQVLI